MDLYDQGRYAEAWLKFRQSSQKDPAYVEAKYWVGKMYYFMDRYVHARRAYEKFVYLDSAHPRMGDAIVEYLHMYEKLNAPPETLLELYDYFQKRWPNVKVHDHIFHFNVGVSGKWLSLRSAKVLQELGSSPKYSPV